MSGAQASRAHISGAQMSGAQRGLEREVTSPPPLLLPMLPSPEPNPAYASAVLYFREQKQTTTKVNWFVPTITRTGTGVTSAGWWGRRNRTRMGSNLNRPHHSETPPPTHPYLNLPVSHLNELPKCHWRRSVEMIPLSNPNTHTHTQFSLKHYSGFEKPITTKHIRGNYTLITCHFVITDSSDFRVHYRWTKEKEISVYESSAVRKVYFSTVQDFVIRKAQLPTVSPNALMTTAKL